MTETFVTIETGTAETEPQKGSVEKLEDEGTTVDMVSAQEGTDNAEAEHVKEENAEAEQSENAEVKQANEEKMMVDDSNGENVGKSGDDRQNTEMRETSTIQVHQMSNDVDTSEIKDEIDEVTDEPLSRLQRVQRELKMNQIRGSREPIAQITVNIGPIRLEDLNNREMKDVLRCSTNFTVKFDMEEKSSSSGVKKKYFDLLGYVKIPYAFRSQRYLVKMYDMLKNLHIDKRDLSVSFPPEFVTAVEKSRKLIEELAKEAQERRDMKISLEKKANEEVQKKSLYVHNLPTNVEEETLKALFQDCSNCVVPKSSEGINMGFGILEFKDAEAADKCLAGAGDLEVEKKKIHLSRLSVSGAPTNKEGRSQRGERSSNEGRRNQRSGQPRSRNRNRGLMRGRRNGRRGSENQAQRSEPSKQTPQSQQTGDSSRRGRQGNNRQSNKRVRTRSLSGGGNSKRSRRGSQGWRGRDGQGGGSWGAPARLMGGNQSRPSVEAEAQIAFLRNKLVAMEDQLTKKTGPYDRGYDTMSSAFGYGYMSDLPSNVGGGGGRYSSARREDMYSDYIRGLERDPYRGPYPY